MSMFEPLSAYVIETANGKRTWWADDEAHALEQHNDDYKGPDGMDPGETVIAVTLDPYAEPPTAGQDPYGRPDPQTHPEFWRE